MLSIVASHAVRVTGTTAEQRPLATALLKRALHGAHRKPAAVLRAILAWNGSYNRTDSAGTVASGAAGRIIGGELPNTEHVFDVSLGQAYALRRLGPASTRLAAARAFDQLAAKFHSSSTAKWREPRTMFDVSSQGAESPPPMPFFDRGTFEQFVELAGG